MLPNNYVTTWGYDKRKSIRVDILLITNNFKQTWMYEGEEKHRYQIKEGIEIEIMTFPSNLFD